MNGAARRIRLLFDSNVLTIHVEHPRRLARFRFDVIESIVFIQRRWINVVDPGEVKDDLAQDMYGVLSGLPSALSPGGYCKPSGVTVDRACRYELHSDIRQRVLPTDPEGSAVRECEPVTARLDFGFPLSQGICYMLEFMYHRLSFK
jgi:hypothetical protein